VWSRFWRRVWAAIQRDFIAGLLVFVPVGFTILGVLWLVRQLDRLVLPRVFNAVGLESNQPPLLGVIVTLSLILLAGALTRSFIGRATLLLWERLVRRIPVAGSLYAVLKQFMETVFSGDTGQTNFRRVVLIEYPRQGLWSYAFVTGRVPPNPETGEGALAKLFVPSTPNPTTGYFLLIPEEDAQDTGLTVDEAFRLIISAGIAGDQVKGPSRPMTTTRGSPTP
jgi:uncharacterized membrane protein